MNPTVEVELHCTCVGGEPALVRTYAFAAKTLLRDWVAQHQGPDCAPTAALVGLVHESTQDPEAWAWVDAQLQKVDRWIAERNAA